MKYTVTKYLNVRVGSPSLNAPCYQYLAPGSELETDGLSYKGDPFEGSDDWLKDQANNFYWAGGVNQLIENEVARSDYWFKRLAIADIWETFNERGENARVLILDSGINDLSPVFDGAIVQKRNFVVGSNNMSSNDLLCHGTHCAGLIAARPTQYSVGIAPKAQLLVGKITENGGLNDGATMRKALEEFLKPEYEFDIISISATISQEDQQLKALLDKHIEKNRIVIAAIGNDPMSKNLPYKNYPAFFDNCISVGACEYDMTISKYTCSPDKASIYCFGTHIGSYQKGTIPRSLKGTSQATAILAGLCALIISFLIKRNKPFDQSFIKQLLIEHSDPLSDFQADVVNPKKLFQFLNTI